MSVILKFLITYVSINNLLYFVIHSLKLYIDSLSCNQSLCIGIKAEGPISFKSTESVARVINLKKYISFVIKSLSIVPHFFLPLLSYYATSLVQIISNNNNNNNNKNNQTSLCQSSNMLLNSFPLEKLIEPIAKFHIRKFKIRFSVFEWVK